MSSLRCAGARFGAVLTLLLHAGSALAYCRTTTCDPAKEDCQNVAGCATRGLPLFWKQRCVSFSVQKDGSPRQALSHGTAEGIISASLETWLDVDCGDRKAPSLELNTTEAVSCARVGYDETGPNANIWMFRDEWPYQSTGTTLALTTVTFDTKSGEILDADVELNSAQHAFTTGDTNVQNDLQSIVTHEAGHFFGLAHSNVREGTMYAAYERGATGLRTLDEDDVAGICAIYAPDRALTGSCTPTNGFSPDCIAGDAGGAGGTDAGGRDAGTRDAGRPGPSDQDSPSDSGCSCVVPGRGPSTSMTTLLAIMSVAGASLAGRRRDRPS